MTTMTIVTVAWHSDSTWVSSLFGLAMHVALVRMRHRSKGAPAACPLPSSLLGMVEDMERLRRLQSRKQNKKPALRHWNSHHSLPILPRH